MNTLNISDPLTISVCSVLVVTVLWALKARSLMYFFVIFLQVRYLLWRGLFTLDTASAIGLGATLTLFIAESYGLFQNLFFYYQIRKPIQRIPEEPVAYPSVDIFVTIVNEPLTILKRTLIGCLAQDYPKESFTVHVLDDGNRKEVKSLARELGCHYLSREEKTHAKAGNINHALQFTQGELVVLFDVDHVPVRNFLRKTVGFFQDDKVAIVQTPHHFYNPDIFQKNLRLEKEIRNEQDLFFNTIQAGRDAHNSAFFAGSSGVFRRSALQEIGGFRTATLTEDLHTSLILHSRGWKSCYLNEILSAGLSPESLISYQKQRERWAMGAVQTLIKDNPLWKRGLTIPQRADYFASIYYFFHGLPRIIYLAAPLSFLLFGVSPIIARPLDLIHYFLAYYLTSVLLINDVSKGSRRILWSDVYESVICFTLSKAIVKAFLRGSKSSFHITPKGEVGERRLEWRHALPHIVLLVAIVIGIGKALIVGSGNQGALWISLFWAALNILILSLATFAFLERPQRRKLLRLTKKIPCVIQCAGKMVAGLTEDLSERGTSIRVENQIFFAHPHVELELRSSYGENTKVKGEIRRQEVDAQGMVLGIAFRETDESTYRSLVRQMFSAPESWGREGEERGFLLDLILPVSGLINPWKKDRNLNRVHPRFPVQKACTLMTDEGDFAGTTVDVSYSGLSMVTLHSEEVTLPLGNSRLQLKDVTLIVTPISFKRVGKHNKFHLKVKAIVKGEKAWENLTMPF